MKASKLPIQSVAPNLSLRANFSWTFLGNVIYAACQWGMLVVLAKLGSPEMVGQFALGLAVTAPVVVFTNLQLRSIQATDARREYAFKHYLYLRLITTPLSLLTIIVVTIISEYHWETAIIIVVIASAKIFESIGDVCYGLMQQHEKMDRIAKSMIIKGILSLLAIMSGVYLFNSVLAGVTGLLFAWMIPLIVYDLKNSMSILQNDSEVGGNEAIVPCTWIGYLYQNWDIYILAKLARTALPLGIVVLLGSLITNIPRYFITANFGEHELGIYAAMAYAMVVGTTVIDALGQSASPRLSKYYAMGNIREFYKLIVKLIVISIVLSGLGVVLAIFIGRQILSLIYQPEYAQHANVLVWLLIGAGLGYIASVLGFGITAVRYFKVQVPLNIMFVIIMLLSSIMFIPMYGALGAAWATCISFGFQIPFKGIVLARALRNGTTDNKL